MLSPDELERYARHIVLREVGGPGQAALKRARVLVIGAGGLGAPALLYLAAAGVGTLGVIDDDTVALSNLQRQVIHGTPEIGEPKIDKRGGRDPPPQSARGGGDPCDAAGGGQCARSRRQLRHRCRRLRQFRHALSRVRCLLLCEEAAGHRGGRHFRRHAHDASARTSAEPTGPPIRPIAVFSPSRRRPAPFRPARRPASWARSPACSAR